MSAARLALAACALSALAGCGSSLIQVGAANPSRSVAAGAPPEETFGAQVEVHTTSAVFFGELIACENNGVFVRLNGESRQPYLAFYTEGIDQLTLKAGGSQVGAYTAWTVLGAVSTITHGVFLIFTAPIWLAVGIPLAVSQPGYTKLGRTVACTDVAPYARFPQGMPLTYPHAFTAPSGAPFPRRFPAGAPAPYRAPYPNGPVQPAPLPAPAPAPAPVAPPVAPSDTGVFEQR